MSILRHSKGDSDDASLRHTKDIVGSSFTHELALVRKGQAISKEASHNVFLVFLSFGLIAVAAFLISMASVALHREHERAVYNQDLHHKYFSPIV